MALVDARGLSCPQPLMLVMEALKKDKSHGPMTILVDSESALESVLRVLNKEKRRTEVSRSGDETTVKVEGA